MAKNSGSTQSLLKTTKFASVIFKHTTIPVTKTSFNFPQKITKIATEKSKNNSKRERDRLCEKCYLGESHPFGEIYCWDCDYWYEDTIEISKGGK